MGEVPNLVESGRMSRNYGGEMRESSRGRGNSECKHPEVERWQQSWEHFQ